MKNILLLLVLIIGLQTANAQYVTIPDANFRAALKTLYPSCFNASNMMDTTCNAILIEDTLLIRSKAIYSIEGIQYFKNLKTLDCAANAITTWPILSKNLIELDCTNNRLISLPILPNSLQTLYCSQNLFTNLSIVLPKLKNLNCSNNQITNLSVLSDSIMYLDFSNNQISNLPILPTTLKNLNCSNNQITNLPILPTNLQYLYCVSNKLVSLPVIPNTLEYMFCKNNNLIVLPDLSRSSLFNLNCDNNQLSELPTLPITLRQLDCNNNQLKTLSALSGTILESLSCDNNQIIVLPILPNSLGILSCSFNQLISLPILSNNIQYLFCDNNKLTSLPILPNSLGQLYCSRNQITALPVLSDRIYVLDCSFNPLNCLPLIKYYINKLLIKNTNIACLPNALHSNVIIDTILPICTNTSNICEVNPFVQGKIYNDANNNGVYNNGEELISQQIIKVTPNNWIGGSDINGNYLVKLDTSINNTWSAINNYRYATITPASYTKNPKDTLGLISGSYDFGIHFIPNVKDLETTLGSSPARPGFTTNVSLSINNVGTTNQSNITIKLKKPSGFNVLSTSIAPTSTITDTLIWNNISINYLQHQSINVELQVPVNAVLGDNAVYEAWANGTQGDSTPLDNYTKWTEVIRGSFDPNDKLVNKASLPPTYNANKDRLLYTIRFQNTGTDTAFTVIVRDEIPNNLDVSSLRVVNASHKYQLIVREKNIVEVAFPNIQLPDSNANEAKSHGFVQLEFKPKAGLPLNAEINNNASIFFDYNLPIITNTATTKVQITTGISSNKKLAFKLFPNPSSEKITVELPYNGNGTWQLFDINGNSIKQNNIIDNNTTFDINVADIANGTYLLSLEINGNISTSKVVILR